MSTAALGEKDLRVRSAVMQQLDFDPAVDASGIGVTAHDGVVSLTGFVNTYAGKLAAERSARRVAGVRAVANYLDVHLLAGRTDTDIAADAATALRLHDIPHTVQAVVRYAQLTLTGTVSWHFQQVEAHNAVRHIRGVRHLVDHIVVKPETSVHDLERRITAALYRCVTGDARRIQVAVTGKVARLTGTVGSWQQRTAAERAAFDAAGIAMVDNEIIVEPPDEAYEICQESNPGQVDVVGLPAKRGSASGDRTY